MRVTELPHRDGRHGSEPPVEFHLVVALLAVTIIAIIFFLKS